MIVPAICKKDELTVAFDKLRYSDKLVFYNGTIDDSRFYCYGTGDSDWTNGRFQYAICDSEETLIGYVAYTIDYYSSCCYNFGLMSFVDEPSIYIALAIREVIGNIQKQKLNRIEFRAIQGNPVIGSYDKLRDYFSEHGYKTKKHTFTQVFKDRYGEYHDDYMYEFVRKKPLDED